MSETREFTVYVCPDCGHVMGDDLRDATDVAEKGPPACPIRDRDGHWDTDMEPVTVVDRAALLTEIEDEGTVEEVARELYRDEQRGVRVDWTRWDLLSPALQEPWRNRAQIAARVIRSRFRGEESDDG